MTISTIENPVLATEAGALIRRAPVSARRDARNLNTLVDRRDPSALVSIPARKFGRDWTVNKADLAAFERLVFIDDSAPADAGASRELGLLIYTGYVGAWVAVGSIWPLVTLAATEPKVCAVSSVSDGGGGRLEHRAEVEVFDEARFREALNEVFA